MMVLKGPGAPFLAELQVNAWLWWALISGCSRCAGAAMLVGQPDAKARASGEDPGPEA